MLHFSIHFCTHELSQSSAVPGDWAQRRGAGEWLGEGCEVTISSPCGQ